MQNGGDGGRARDVVREDQEGVLARDDAQAETFSKRIEDVVLSLSCLTASPLAVGVVLVGLGVAAPEAPDEGSLAFFDEGIGSALGELRKKNLVT